MPNTNLLATAFDAQYQLTWTGAEGDRKITCAEHQAQHQHTGTGTEEPAKMTRSGPTVQCQQLGDGQLSYINHAAQLTHPISRADDVDMTFHPITPHSENQDTTTPRRRVGGRCCKGCGEHTDAVPVQQAQVRFMHNVWSTVRAGRVLPCNSGPTAAHNEPTCTPSASQAASVATDREAVETVTRFRDSVLNAVAPVEVVLLIYEEPDVNSTEGFDEDDRLFARTWTSNG